MRDLAAALQTEVLKALRSKLPWATVLAMLVGGAVGGGFVFVLQNPDRARSLGLLGSKAQFANATADWPGYFDLTAQIIAVGGLLVFGLVTTWLFGREFSDRTAKDLLALPVARATIVAAKFIVALAWSLALTAEILAITLALGHLLGLHGWTASAALHGLGTVFATSALTITLAATYGLAASVGRGYLPAVAVLFVTLLAAQVIAALGYGTWFPWSVPSLLSGIAGPQQRPGAPGILGVILVGLAATLITEQWWKRADQTQ